MSNNKNSKKSKVSTKDFALIKATSINGVLQPIGFKVKLSEEGEADFRKKNRIK